MLILLPPSEGKAAAAASNPPVDLAELSFPQLTEARERVAEVLAEVSTQEDALEQLKVGASLAAEVQRNARLFAEPAHPASSVYTGVLYEAFDYASLSEQAKAAADSSVLVISALWGAVRMDDSIPAYRLSMGVKLGDCGNLATFWRGELTGVLDNYAGQQLVLDCRSAAYAKAWVPAPERTLAVRVEKELADGSRKVVSHMAKHYRGELARYLVEQKLTGLDSLQELVAALESHWQVELVEPTNKKAGSLTLVIAE